MNLTTANRCGILYEQLHRIPKSKWNYQSVRAVKKNSVRIVGNEVICGSTGCALGWCPITFPRDFKMSIENKNGDFEIDVLFRGESVGDDDSKVHSFFGITEEECNKLFWGREAEEYYGKDDLQDITPQDVARKLKELVEKYGYELV